MKTLITVKRLDSIRPILTNEFEMNIEVDMTEAQMYETLNRFLGCVNDETWAKWQEQINSEIYGATS